MQQHAVLEVGRESSAGSGDVDPDAKAGDQWKLDEDRGMFRTDVVGKEKETGMYVRNPHEEIGWVGGEQDRVNDDKFRNKIIFEAELDGSGRDLVASS